MARNFVPGRNVTLCVCLYVSASVGFSLFVSMCLIVYSMSLSVCMFVCLCKSVLRFVIVCGGVCVCVSVSVGQ